MKALQWVMHIPANLMRLLIHIYQHTLSLAFGPVCKYYPSCSHYADRAYQVHGFFKGTILTSWRLLRCNPLSDGGVDYPPVKGSWTNPWTEPGSVTEETYFGSIERENVSENAGATGDAIETKQEKVGTCC